LGEDKVLLSELSHVVVLLSC